MKNIFIIGAGLSAGSLIHYLLNASQDHGWRLTVGDISLETARHKVANHPNGRAIQFNINEQEQREREICAADLVVSMLPGALHPLVAKECLKYGKHLLTPSYVTPEIQGLDAAVREKGLSFLNELGVDPGIDHMSAMRVIDRIKKKGGEILSFQSFCGGLVAPDCDDNPWHYKFSWNPRNVVVAGQGVAKYKENGAYKYVSYPQLFSRLRPVEVPGYGSFEVYPNRDSLQYCKLYGLEDIPSILRGTIRCSGYAEAWNLFVQLGCTDDSYIMQDSHLLSYRQYLESFLPYAEGQTTEEKLTAFAALSPDSEIMNKLRWLGIFSDEKIGIKDATPAMVMQKILEQKWAMRPQDRDLLIMQHHFDYVQNGEKKRIISSMCCEGKDQEHTAMAYTVGTPLAIATKLLATGAIQLPGVHIPTLPVIYNPILDELESLGIKFSENEIDL